MRRVGAFVRSLALAVIVPSSGCALLTKAEPLVPRYFSPESPDGSVGRARSAPAASPGVALQLGRVAGASYLKERIVYRAGEHELGLYDDQRWTERPEVFLRRALERALFEQRGVTRALSTSAPTLTAELLEFEEVRGPRPQARIRVAFTLRDESTVLRERTLTVDRPIAQAREGSSAMVAAMGVALGDLVDAIADQIVDDLRRPR